MAKIDTLFMTKTGEKPYPLVPAHTYIAHIREYLPGISYTKHKCLAIIHA